MGYIDDNLMAKERVLYRAKLHWIVFARPAILLILAVILFSVDDSTAGVGKVCFILFIATGLLALISYLTSEFGVTDRRVLAKFGFIRRHSLEVLLRQVEAIEVNQDILERILGYGSVTVIGTGGTRNTFMDIAAPLQLRRAVQEQIAKIEDGE